MPANYDDILQGAVFPFEKVNRNIYNSWTEGDCWNNPWLLISQGKRKTHADMKSLPLGWDVSVDVAKKCLFLYNKSQFHLTLQQWTIQTVKWWQSWEYLDTRDTSNDKNCISSAAVAGEEETCAY